MHDGVQSAARAVETGDGFEIVGPKSASRCTRAPASGSVAGRDSLPRPSLVYRSLLTQDDAYDRPTPSPANDNYRSPSSIAALSFAPIAD